MHWRNESSFTAMGGENGLERNIWGDVARKSLNSAHKNRVEEKKRKGEVPE